MGGTDAFLALLDHRNTPPTGVQVSPTQRLFNRRTRSLLPMTASLLAPQAVPDNEQCKAKLEQRKQRQARYNNRGAVDLEPLKRGETVRLTPFHLGKREWSKGVVQNRLGKRSYEVETPHSTVRRNRVDPCVITLVRCHSPRPIALVVEEEHRIFPSIRFAS